MKQIVVKRCEILSLLLNSSDQHFAIKGLPHQASSSKKKIFRKCFMME
jgi:hypothetical protein